VKAVAETLGVARSSLIKQLAQRPGSGGTYAKAGDAVLLIRVRRLVDARPTCGYRRITALMNRELAADRAPPANHKRIYRLMKAHGLLLGRHGGERLGRRHDGKVIVMRSDLRWCSDGLEFACWNGEVVRVASVIDAHDREIIAWRAVAGAGISGSDVRDMMLEAVERRFGTTRTPNQVEFLADNGSPYRARDTRVFAAQLGLVPCFTPVASPESNGMCEAFVRTFKRDYVEVSPIPTASLALARIGEWIEDYNEVHPHSALRMRSPRGFRRANSPAEVSA
jgi:putative transposase